MKNYYFQRNALQFENYMATIGTLLLVVLEANQLVEVLHL